MTKKIHPQITLILFLICVICGPAYGQTDRWLDYAPVDYDIFPNVTYAKASNFELKLDLYLPKDRSRPKTTLILFHGGGWVDGQKERNVLYLLPYLELGWSAINVEYRTARQAPAPAAVEDTRCALRWLTYHARDYGLDPARFANQSTLILLFEERSPNDGSCAPGEPSDQLATRHGRRSNAGFLDGRVELVTETNSVMRDHIKPRLMR